jgi:hypothetical protein
MGVDDGRLYHISQSGKARGRGPQRRPGVEREHGYYRHRTAEDPRLHDGDFVELQLVEFQLQQLQLVAFELQQFAFKLQLVAVEFQLQQQFIAFEFEFIIKQQRLGGL